MNPKYDKAWELMLAIFPRWEVPAGTRDLWDALLSLDTSPAALEAGAIYFGLDSNFPPSLSAWHHAAWWTDPARPKRMEAAEAWDEMYRNRHARYTRKVTWSSEAVLRAARSVHWDDPNWLSEQIPTIRAQFERYYTALSLKTERIDGAILARGLAERIEHAERSGNAHLLYGPGFTDDAE